MPESTPISIIAREIECVCGDGNSDARRVATEVLAALERCGFAVVAGTTDQTQSDPTPTDEFYGNLWWRPDGAGRLRSATLGECAGEIQRLRGVLAASLAACEEIADRLGTDEGFAAVLCFNEITELMGAGSVKHA
jgi:hypothetical protein